MGVVEPPEEPGIKLLQALSAPLSAFIFSSPNGDNNACPLIVVKGKEIMENTVLKKKKEINTYGYDYASN